MSSALPNSSAMVFGAILAGLVFELYFNGHCFCLDGAIRTPPKQAVSQLGFQPADRGTTRIDRIAEGLGERGDCDTTAGQIGIAIDPEAQPEATQ